MRPLSDRFAMISAMVEMDYPITSIDQLKSVMRSDDSRKVAAVEFIPNFNGRPQIVLWGFIYSGAGDLFKNLTETGMLACFDAGLGQVGQAMKQAADYTKKYFFKEA